MGNGNDEEESGRALRGHAAFGGLLSEGSGLDIMDVNIAVVFLNKNTHALRLRALRVLQWTKKEKRKKTTHRWRTAESFRSCACESDALADQSAANQFLIMLWAEESSC